MQREHNLNLETSESEGADEIEHLNSYVLETKTDLKLFEGIVSRKPKAIAKVGGKQREEQHIIV